MNLTEQGYLGYDETGVLWNVVGLVGVGLIGYDRPGCIMLRSPLGCIAHEGKLRSLLGARFSESQLRSAIVHAFYLLWMKS